VTPKVQEGKGGCRGKTKRGTICNSNALRKGTVIEGVIVSGKYCRTHDATLPDLARFGSHAQAREAAKLAGRPPMPKPTEVMRNLIEESVEAIIAPHFRTLGLKLERGDDGRLHAVVDPTGGAKIFGESKEGEINMTKFDDLGAHIAAAEKLLDRVYGKPKQSTELTGAEGGAVEIVPVSRDKADAVAKMRAAIGLGAG
jgi:hypothetical protein